MYCLVIIKQQTLRTKTYSLLLSWCFQLVWCNDCLVHNKKLRLKTQLTKKRQIRRHEKSGQNMREIEMRRIPREDLSIEMERRIQMICSVFLPCGRRTTASESSR